MPNKIRDFIDLVGCVFVLMVILQSGSALADSWPQERREHLRVCWEIPDFTEEKQWVVGAIEREYGSRQLLTVTEWSECDTMPDANIRITIMDQGPHTRGIGPQLDQLEHGVVFNFTFMHWGRSCKAQRRECIEGIAVHEFGHVLGLPDAAIPMGGDSATCSGVQLATQEVQSDVVIGEDSVMNYCNPNWRSGRLTGTDLVAIGSMFQLQGK